MTKFEDLSLPRLNICIKPWSPSTLSTPTSTPAPPINMEGINIADFATRQLALLDGELQAELEETQMLTATHAPSVLQRAGLALLNLSVASQRTGFGGKTMLELAIDPAVGGGEFPEHAFRVGDICAVAEQPRGAERKKERDGMERRSVEGVITKVQKENLVVSLDKEDADVPNGKLWLYVCFHQCKR